MNQPPAVWRPALVNPITEKVEGSVSPMTMKVKLFSPAAKAVVRKKVAQQLMKRSEEMSKHGENMSRLTSSLDTRIYTIKSTEESSCNTGVVESLEDGGGAACDHSQRSQSTGVQRAHSHSGQDEEA
ncbi:hypothetical protein HWI79_2850 [Cryptosporidium felis]|nr:hypothetical protein HWI79_2850 [Cryptosporidium felis]